MASLGQSDSLPKTGTQSATEGQPSVVDFAQSNQFKVWFEIFPQTTFFITRVNSLRMKNKIPYMRWPQAPLFYALTKYYLIKFI